MSHCRKTVKRLALAVLLGGLLVVPAGAATSDVRNQGAGSSATSHESTVIVVPGTSQTVPGREDPIQMDVPTSTTTVPTGVPTVPNHDETPAGTVPVPETTDQNAQEQNAADPATPGKQATEQQTTKEQPSEQAAPDKQAQGQTPPAQQSPPDKTHTPSQPNSAAHPAPSPAGQQPMTPEAFLPKSKAPTKDTAKPKAEAKPQNKPGAATPPGEMPLVIPDEAVKAKNPGFMQGKWTITPSGGASAKDLKLSLDLGADGQGQMVIDGPKGQCTGAAGTTLDGTGALRVTTGDALCPDGTSYTGMTLDCASMHAQPASCSGRLDLNGAPSWPATLSRR
ncbi:MAG: hypothetical protein AB7D57_11125 [Desulfovibrionaceae bacterium]